MATYLSQSDEALRRVTAKPALNVSRAAARYRITSALIADMARVMSTRDLTDVERADLEHVQAVNCESRAVLTAAGRLDLIGGA
ncbi:hypothetical protein [Streptomyces leeuwenhoekii]|uniref:Sle1_104 protein n=1 Tax=Streptomyces leeuwenhoekii TaxID=1437453 RepID=A0A0F7VR41_STRLW|nr:hypothetical protein [Streptomyces leeuwenhoekii]CQR59271.1 sle1_104 [Streptomyces leeuwenhoekii]